MVIILMGVAGAGKTVVGRRLATELGWRLVDADDYHSPEHVAKMHRGEPLTDADRGPWLAALHAIVARAVDRREHLVLACSALKERYRQTLRGDLHGVRFAHLTADQATLRRRLESRPGHFARANLLPTQLQTLELPGADEALIVDTTAPPEHVIGLIRREFGL